jgi:hypothetical protein
MTHKSQQDTRERGRTNLENSLKRTSRQDAKENRPQDVMLLGRNLRTSRGPGRSRRYGQRYTIDFTMQTAVRRATIRSG